MNRARIDRVSFKQALDGFVEQTKYQVICRSISWEDEIGACLMGIIITSIIDKCCYANKSSQKVI